jgi:hypothetical protein
MFGETLAGAERDCIIKLHLFLGARASCPLFREFMDGGAGKSEPQFSDFRFQSRKDAEERVWLAAAWGLSGNSRQCGRGRPRSRGKLKMITVFHGKWVLGAAGFRKFHPGSNGGATWLMRDIRLCRLWLWF